MRKQPQIQIIKIIEKIKRIKRELDVTLSQLRLGMKDGTTRTQQCSNCGRRNVRVRLNHTYFCYSCGYDSKIQITQ